MPVETRCAVTYLAMWLGTPRTLRQVIATGSGMIDGGFAYIIVIGWMTSGVCRATLPLNILQATARRAMLSPLQ